MESELIEIAQNIGFLEDDTYYIGENCNASLMELYDYIGDPTDDVTKLLAFCRTKIFENDIIPLICSQPTDERTYFAAFQLVDVITTPYLISNPDAEKSPAIYSQHIELIDHQIQIKHEICDTEFLTYLSAYFIFFLKQYESTKPDEHWCQHIELTFSIFHNILFEENLSRNIYKNASAAQLIYEKLLRRLIKTGCLKFFSFMASSKDHSFWCYHLADILYLTLRFIDPLSLSLPSFSPRSGSLQMLSHLLEKEQECKLKKLRNTSSRHGAFGGTVVKYENDVSFFAKTIPNYKDTGAESLQTDKKILRKTSKQIQKINAMNYREIPDDLSREISSFCIELLKSFNFFYCHIRDFCADSYNQATEKHFLWYLSFFLIFNTKTQQNIDLIGSVINAEAFSLVYRLLTKIIEDTKFDRKSANDRVIDLNYCILFYKEFFNYVAKMRDSSDSSLNHAANIILDNIFYVSEYKDIYINIFKHYRKDFYPLNFVRDLVQSFNVLFSTLREFYNTRSAFFVRKKKGRSKKPKKTGSWKAIEKYVKSFYAESLISNVEHVPIDYMSETSVNDQIENYKQNIAQLLEMKKYQEALSLFIGLSNYLGREDEGLDKHLDTLKNIYFIYHKCANDIDEKSHSDDNHSSSPDSSDSYTEKLFDFDVYMRKYGCTFVARAYSDLLKNFANNEPYTNRCIFDFIRYISFDLKLPHLFYHVHFFNSFNNILNSPNLLDNRTLEVIQFITVNFLECVRLRGPQLFGELLFWKPLSLLHSVFVEGVTLESVADETTINPITTVCEPSPVKRRLIFENPASLDIENIHPSSKSDEASASPDLHSNPSLVEPAPSPENSNSGKLSPTALVDISNISLDCPDSSKAETSRNVQECQISSLTRLILEKGYKRIIEWLLRSMATEKETRDFFLLENKEPLDLIPDAGDVLILNQKLFREYFSLLGFVPPTDEFDDPYWKLPYVSHSTIKKILIHEIETFSN